MTEWMLSVAHFIERSIGWAFGPSWLPPTDFQLLRWLVVPGYGYGILLIAFGALELAIPQQRRPWSRATLLSGTYLLLAGTIAFYALIVVPLIRNAWLYLGIPSLHLDRTLPLALYMPVALLVVTFAAYWSHRLMHRVPIFWHIHKIHHSPPNLNFTGSFHNHFLERLIQTPTHLIVTLALGTDLVAPFGVIFMGVDFLAHANVRVNLGKLTYVLCTPQAHRVHHSVDPKHFDTNFGNTFMLWDHLFGTFYYDPSDPPTRYGVDEVPQGFIKQQVMPLVWIWRTMVAGVRRGQVRTGT